VATISAKSRDVEQIYYSKIDELLVAVNRITPRADYAYPGDVTSLARYTLADFVRMRCAPIRRFNRFWCVSFANAVRSVYQLSLRLVKQKIALSTHQRLYFSTRIKDADASSDDDGDSDSDGEPGDNIPLALLTGMSDSKLAQVDNYDRDYRPDDSDNDDDDHVDETTLSDSKSTSDDVRMSVDPVSGSTRSQFRSEAQTQLRNCISAFEGLEEEGAIAENVYPESMMRYIYPFLPAALRSLADVLAFGQNIFDGRVTTADASMVTIRNLSARARVEGTVNSDGVYKRIESEKSALITEYDKAMAKRANKKMSIDYISGDDDDYYGDDAGSDDDDDEIIDD